MFGANHAPVLHQDQHYLQMDQNELPLEPRDLGVPLGASKTISEPMIHSVRTVHLSCSDANSVSNRTKTRFHKTHVTYKFHRVRPKQFLSQWCIRRKLCSDLASRLALSPNGRKWASTWTSSPRSTIGCVHKDYWFYGTIGAIHAPILHWH
jgi:hypothetical protein